MILDKLLQFDPAATPITVSAPSTNVLDLLNARDIAIGDDHDLIARVTVTQAFTAAGGATLQVQLQSSVDNASWTTIVQSDAVPKANLTVGQVIDIVASPIPPQAAGLPRYYRLNYVVATGPFTAGQVESDLVVSGIQRNNPPSYPSGFTVAN